MNALTKFECPSCLRLFDKEDEAINCHPVRRVFLCDHCGIDYDDQISAEFCGVEDTEVWEKDSKLKTQVEELYDNNRRPSKRT